MSATARSAPTAGAGPDWGVLAASGVLLALAVLAAILAPPFDGAAPAAGDPLSGPRFGLGATRLLALVLPGPNPLWAASWFGLPLMAALGLFLARGRPGRAVLLGACALLNPLLWLAAAAGYGLMGAGLLAVAAALSALPEQRAHPGFMLAGLGVLAASAAVPGSPALALPLFAVLFLCAPRPWQPGTMRALYLTAFTPALSWAGTLAYLGWQAGVAPATAIAQPDDAWHLMLGLSLSVFCAPGLLVEGRRNLAGLAILLLGGLVFVAPGIPLVAGPLLCWSGQIAVALRRGRPLDLVFVGFGSLSSAGAAWLLG